MFHNPRPLPKRPDLADQVQHFRKPSCRVRVSYTGHSTAVSLNISSCQLAKHFVFINSEILVASQESGVCLIWWTLIGAVECTVAGGTSIGSIADVQVVSGTKCGTVIDVAMDPIWAIATSQQHLSWTKPSRVYQAEQERLGAGVVGTARALKNGQDRMITDFDRRTTKFLQEQCHTLISHFGPAQNSNTLKQHTLSLPPTWIIRTSYTKRLSNATERKYLHHLLFQGMSEYPPKM